MIEDMYFGNNLLFHYTKLETAMELILTAKRLRFTSFKNVNDPHERGYKSLSLNWSNRNPIDESLVDYDKYQKEVDSIRLDESKILCFSKNANSITKTRSSVLDKDLYYKTGFFKMRMWAQYGDLHRGLCLAFSRDNLVDDIKKTYTDFKLYRGDIRYKDSSLDMRQAYHIELTNDALTNFRDFFISEHLIKYRENLFFTKNTDWRDEFEYRLLLLTDNKKPDYFIDIRNSLKAVFCGLDFPDVYMRSLRNLLKFTDIEIYRLDLSNGIPSVINL
jgi:hypothetical protein